MLGNGSFCFNDALPGGDEGVKLGEVWGFMDSQETVGISPDMFGEFIFPAYKKVADQYGMLSYGCCEPVDPFYDDYISKFSKLRKLSISPWANEAIMGEKLRGSNIIYHRKPTPNLLGVGKDLDEKALRKHIRTTLEAAKGCQIEFAQRDVYTLGGNLDKVKRYVDIIREESMTFV